MVVEEGKRVSEVARELGCSTSAITKWVRDYKQHGDGSFPGKGNLTPEDQRIKGKLPPKHGEAEQVAFVVCGRSFLEGSMEKKQYTKEFKLGAVKLVVHEGKTIAAVAKDLGIGYSTLGHWVQDFRKHKVDVFPGKGNLLPWDQEKREFEKKLNRAEMERDILKKRSCSSRNSTGKIHSNRGSVRGISCEHFV